MEKINLLILWFEGLGAIWLLFIRAEPRMRPPFKSAWSRWIKRVMDPTSHIGRWPMLFADLFDNLLKVRPRRLGARRWISLPNLGRSCFSSLLTVVFITTIWLTFLPDLQIKFESSAGYILPFYVSIGGHHFDIEYLLLVTVLINLIPDYISLIETRYVIMRMGRAHSVLGLITWLFADAIATMLIAFGVFIFAVPIAWAAFGSYGLNAGPFDVGLAAKVFYAEGLPMILGSTSGDAVFGIFIYSTFFTSIWVWLFIISGGIARLFYVFAKAFRVANLAFYLEEYLIDHPVRAMGVISIVGFSTFLVII